MHAWPVFLFIHMGNERQASRRNTPRSKRAHRMRQTKLSTSSLHCASAARDFTFIKFSRGQPSSAPPPLALVLGACDSSALPIHQRCTLTWLRAHRIAGNTSARRDSLCGKRETPQRSLPPLLDAQIGFGNA